MKGKFLLLVLILVLFQSCSINRIIVNNSMGFLDGGINAIFQETDLAFAKSAIPGNIKLAEGFLSQDPENIELLLILSQGYYGYSLLFLENKDNKRAINFYNKGMNYALNALDIKYPDASEKLFELPIKEFYKYILQFNKEDVPILFWTAQNWGSIINLNKSNAENVANLSRVVTIMKRIYELDKIYYNNSAGLFLAFYYSSLPPMLGGNMKLANKYFQENFKITNKDFLLSYLFYAKIYCIRNFDIDLFNETIDYILTYETVPDYKYNLINSFAKHEAQILKETDKDDLF